MSYGACSHLSILLSLLSSLCSVLLCADMSSSDQDSAAHKTFLCSATGGHHGYAAMPETGKKHLSALRQGIPSAKLTRGHNLLTRHHNHLGLFQFLKNVHRIFHMLEFQPQEHASPRSMPLCKFGQLLFCKHTSKLFNTMSTVSSALLAQTT